MKNIEEIDKDLSRITEELDSMWRDINTHIPDEKEADPAIVVLGTAINSINDIRNRIYKIQPNLKPKTWSRE